ncbi:MAG TPA: hypothetical protein VEI02_16435 [Planctomycetota bacterium]|nr:hypothetical protein [Planctomycetota bacterium]
MIPRAVPRCAVLLALAASVVAQAPLGGVRTPEELAGAVDGAASDGEWVEVGEVRRTGAAWIRVRLAPFGLPAGARVRSVGLADGAVAIQDAAALDAWAGWTPYFNGEAVRIDASAPAGATAFVAALVCDHGLAASGQADGLCGPDDRVPSADPRVARLVDPELNAVCTAALVGPNDVLLTAGHCIGFGGGVVVQFDPPPSLPDGTLQHPPPSAQFAVMASSVAGWALGPGDDWAAFRTHPNLVDGTSAAATRGVLTLSPTPPTLGATVSATGCGSDVGVDAFTRQVASGALTLLGGAGGTEARYVVDTEAGGSGSPVTNPSGAVFAVHTHDGCAFGVGNRGTLIAHPALLAHVAALSAGAPGPYVAGLQQLGVGAPLHATVSGAPPNAELFNVVSPYPAYPTGSGWFFGLNPGADGFVFSLFAFPAGAAPIHVFADASGSYAFSLPTSGGTTPVAVDLVSLAFQPGTGFLGYLGRSAVAPTTFFP